MSERLILLAKIGAPHGVKGEVRVTAFGDPDMLNQYGKLETQDGGRLKIRRMRSQKNGLVVKFEGVNTRVEAQALTGTELYVDRGKLPATEDEDEFYLSDLIGLKVHDKSGEALGTIKDIPNFGADDMLEIQPETGSSYYLPFTKAVVPEVDISAGIVTVIPPNEVSERDGK